MFRLPANARGWSLLLALAAVAPLHSADASPFRVLYTFTGGSDGSDPSTTLIVDSAGNFYGTTVGGGASGNGTVFKLAPDGSETVLYSFKGGSDGANPYGGVVADKAGNLYGTASAGGSNGCGVVFRLAPDGKETVLHVFASGKDGCSPLAGLIGDQAGDLYGTTASGGGTGCSPYGCGTVFKLASDGTETELHAFSDVPDGANPYAGLLMDKAGNLYGTTVYGGTNGYAGPMGTVFKVAPDGTETVLRAFDYTDGMYPYGGLILDKAGNLYGTTGWGSILGTVFKLAPDGTETVLHAFTDVPDGANPYAGLVMDEAGNLYGTTTQGGRTCGNYGSSCGTVFKLAPDGTESVLHAFNDHGSGIVPENTLIIGRSGHLYGTTSSTTWKHAGGTLFEIRK